MLIFHDLLNQNHGLSGKSDRKSNPGMLNQALRRAAAIAQGNFNIVLVTDGSGQDQVTGSILQNVSAHNDLAVILVYDPRQVECNGGDRSNAGSLLNFRANLNHSCFLAEGTLTIPLNNQLDPVDQFRRGFRKLLRLRRYQSKRQVQLPQRGGNDARQDESALGAECGSEATISRLPSPLPNPQPLCVQLNSR